MLGIIRCAAQNREPVHSCGGSRRIVRQPGAICLFSVEVWRLMGEVAQTSAADAMIGLGCLLEVHPAHGTTEWTAFFEFEVRPFPDTEIFWDGVTIMADDFECVGMPSDEAIAAGVHQILQNFVGLEMEPLACDAVGMVLAVQLCLKEAFRIGLNPPNQHQRMRISGL